MTEKLMDEYDVVVVGGGAAGLSGGLMLARARRRVLVVDAGEPRNAPASGVHGLLGHDGVPPAELLARGRSEVRRYGGQVVTGEVTAASRLGDGFVVTLDDDRGAGGDGAAVGPVVHARRLLVTTGLVDELPAVAGLAERWGREVLHCPYCHGWEVRDQAIAVLGSGPMSVHQALLFRQWSGDITFVTHTVPPTDEQAEQLEARGVRLVDGKVAALEGDGDDPSGPLTGLRLVDGTLVEAQAVVVSPRVVARAGFLADLGLQPVQHPSGVGTHILADMVDGAAADGVWVAGNVTDPAAQVGAAASSGAMAAARINADLVEEETRLAVEARRRAKVRAGSDL